jgi:tRNA(Ser,Leu) C12 N-acetylase TAN1
MDWNVVISVQEQGYKAARQFLHEYGKIISTDYFNVMVMQVDNLQEFMDDMLMHYEMKTLALAYVGHIMPVSHRFRFQSVDEFEIRAREIVSRWLDELAGKHFYVRIHRRGFKGRLSSMEEERFLDEFILEQLESSGKAPAKVDFSGAERVIAIETLGQEAGMSLWTSEQIKRYPFLKLG